MEYRIAVFKRERERCAHLTRALSTSIRDVRTSLRSPCWATSGVINIAGFLHWFKNVVCIISKTNRTDCFYNRKHPLKGAENCQWPEGITGWTSHGACKAGALDASRARPRVRGHRAKAQRLIVLFSSLPQKDVWSQSPHRATNMFHQSVWSSRRDVGPSASREQKSRFTSRDA